MRYEDASHTGAFAQGSEPDARNDADAIAAGAQGPATGNVITGEGTQTGPSGADYGPGAHITSIAGAGGEDSSFAGGKLAVSGEFGRLSIDADGNYSYEAKKGTPENSRDSFTYTLADSQGNADTATLMIEIGKTPAVIKANAQQIVPGPDGVVILPPGVELSDIQVVGRNLVINLPDGSQMVIIDGAVFVPQLVLGGVEVPATNLAALLVGQEIAPAAGEGPPQSSGGNFDVPVPPLDPGIPLGDLLPPTELFYNPPEVREVFDLLDEEPETGPNPDVLLDDDAQEGGIAGGVGDDPGSDFASGFLSGSGGDGSLTWDLLATGAPTGFSYADGPNGSILVFQNGNPNAVLTITIDPDTGEFTVTQNGPIDHEAGGNENNQLFTINYTVTDEDGDFAPGSFVINVDDDTPTIDVTVGSDANVLLTTQDAQTDGDPTDTDTANTSADFGGIFGASGAFGADGPGSSSLTYALSTTGGASGLASHGAAINLYLIGGVVVGSTAATAGAVNAGNTVFDISVNAVGVVTVNQYSQIDHTNTDPTPTGPGYEDHLISLADGAVTLTLSGSITDGDQDPANDSASVGIGANIRFADDGPSIDPTLNEVGGAVVDESAPVEAATIPLVDGFTRGDDPHLSGELAIGKGSTGGPVIDANAAFGADGPANGGGISYALEVGNIVSGLTTTEGTAINLVELSNGVVVGVVEGTTTVAFAISIDSGTGVVTVEQYLSIFHSDSPDNYDEPAFLNEGSLGVTVTASDFDGDSVTSDAVDITSLIRFEDDGPTASTIGQAADTLVLDETRPVGTETDGDSNPAGLATTTANFADNFTGGSFGADGPKSTSYSLVLSGENVASGLFALDPADTTAGDGDGIGRGAQIVLNQSGNTITGSAGGVDYFTISIDPSTGVVTFTQLANIWHGNTGSDDDTSTLTAAAESILLRQTLTDGDNDVATTDLDLSAGIFQIEDDGPNAAVDIQATLDTLVLDETRPVGTETDGDSNPAGLATTTANFADNFVAPIDYGSDGPGSTVYSLSLNGSNVASGLFALDPADTTAGDGDGIGRGASIVLNQVGNTITGSAGGVDYFTISINPSTGVVTFTQLANIWHSNTGSDDDTSTLNAAVGSILVNQAVTDADGDSDSASIDVSQGVFQIEDDGPNAAIDVQAVLDTLVLDETRPVGTETDGDSSPAGLATVVANFADNFLAPIDFGSDGPGSVGYAFLLSGSNVASGLFALDPADTTAGDGDGIGRGAPIVLNLAGNTITGSAGGVDYFTISINPATGQVTFTQLANIWHSNTGSDDDTSTLTAAVGSVQIQQTVTDADGDSDSAAIDVSQGVFQIEDDGPDAQTSGQGVGIVTLDETRPEGTDVGGGAPTGDISNTINLAAGFVTGGAVDFGSDGAGSVSYALALSANGIGSGMFAIDPTDTSAGDGDGIGRGAEITLSLSGNTVTGSAGGVNYFTITIDPATGITTFTQLDNIWHPTPGASYDEAAVLNTALASNFQVVQTVRDADGDVDTAAVNIGQGVFQTQDDGPVANPDTDTVTGAGGTATGNVITDLHAGDGGDSDAGADDIGEDTPGRVSFIDNANDGAAGAVVPAGGSVSIAGQFGTLEIFANGNYTYTRNDGLGGGQTETFNYTLIDADGDTVTSTLTIQIADNIPVAGTAAAAVDDDGLAGANTLLNPNDINANTFPNPDDLDGPASSEATFRGNLTVTGGDGDIDFSLVAPGAGITIGQETVTISGTGALLTATITASPDATRIGDPLFTVSLNQETGEYIVTLVDNVLHGNDANDDEDGSEVSVNIPFQVNDVDGDPSVANGTLTITFNDDVPDAQVNNSASLDTLVLDETRPEGTDTAGGVAPTGDISTTANFADNFVIAPIPYGADGPGTTTYSLFLSANGIASGLFALDPTDTTAGDGDGIGRGASITLSQVGNTITGSAGGVDYFTISIAPATGVVTFTQLAPIWHPTPGATYDEAANLSTTLAANMQVVQTVTDADGDTDTASINIGQGVFSIQDDGPDAQTSATAVGTVTLDETRPEGTDTAGGSAPTGDASNTINFSVNFVSGGAVDYGADGAGSTLYALALTGANVNSGLFALDGTDTSASDGDGYGQGAQIVLNISGNTVTGSVGATNYFTLTIDPATGIVTFTQLNPIWHPTPGAASFDEAATLTTLTANLLRVVQTVTDADGDVDTASINIGQGVFIIQDDGPQAIQPDPATLENEIGASVTADLDDDSEVITDFGEDLPGLVQFANIGPDGHPSGLTSNEDPIEYWLSNNGQTLQARTNSTNGSDGELIFTVQINQATGDYTVTMTGTIDNGAGVTFDDLTSAKAGNVDVRGVGADDPLTTVDLLLTASGPGGVNATINTDSDSVGSGNQSMNEGETVRIDFVTNLEDDPADDLVTFPSGFSYDGHVGTNSFQQFIPQVQADQSQTVAFQVFALNTTVTDAAMPDDVPTGPGDGWSDASIVTVTKVSVDGFDDGPDDGTPNQPLVTVNIGAVGVWTPIAYGVFAQLQADGSVIFTGIQEGDQYGIETGATDFNAIAVTSLAAGIGPVGNLSTTNAFDLGIFSIGQVDTGDPINISFDLSITDADGDTIALPGAIDITFEPATEALAFSAMSASSTTDGGDGFSNLSFSNDNSKWSGANGNAFGNVGNTGIVAGMVAASGMVAMSTTSFNSFNDPSFNMMVQDSFQQFGAQVVGREGINDNGFASLSFGNEVIEPAFDAVSLSSSSSNDFGSGSHILDAQAFGGAAPAYVPNFAAGDVPAFSAQAFSVAAPTVGMASAEALQLAGLAGNIQIGGSVEKILADALGHGGPPTVDGLLQAITGHGDGAIDAIANAASPAAPFVPAWDMGFHGAFVPGADMMFKMGAEMLHHDAVQPVVNG